ncbi:hypothetical protein B0T14DRAFT_88411 [Immersiella caudata]|uniref:Uncharacterized protein n=1 Tax=Immersiella caudata TaxID=314043 RepID=A0AA39X222_9PEZI|nr:hypothetical protein B0T14DRAFT_88411 [Immersiella caudata]
MGDSPLSITASTAGILTFISAVTAFVYVRYQILQNGRNEISSTLEGAALSFEETKSMQHALLPGDERHEAERIKKSIQDLLKIDMDIWKECAAVAGYPTSDAITAEVPEQSDRIPQPTQYATGEPLHRYLKVVDFLVLGSLASLVWASIKLVLRLSVGITPTLLRWYGVREEVMTKTQQRDMLRSRIMHQQTLLLHIELREVKSALLSTLARLDPSRADSEEVSKATPRSQGKGMVQHQ